MKSSSRCLGVLALAGIVVPTLVTAGAPDQGPAAGSLAAAVEKAAKAPKAEPDQKLDASLQAVAREWRRLGERGARRESEARQIPLKDMRLSAVIELTHAKQRAVVERALRKAWGEVVAYHDGRLYVRLPVPAIRRMSRHAGVQGISVDTKVTAAKGSSEESSR
jgi:hypothetical protein